MRTRGGGVKKSQNFADVKYGCPLCTPENGLVSNGKKTRREKGKTVLKVQSQSLPNLSSQDGLYFPTAMITYRGQSCIVRLTSLAGDMEKEDPHVRVHLRSRSALFPHIIAAFFIGKLSALRQNYISSFFHRSFLSMNVNVERRDPGAISWLSSRACRKIYILPKV